MSLKHTPAHNTHHPDTFIDESCGWEYSVRQDIDAEDPRTWQSLRVASVHPFNTPRNDSSTAAAADLRENPATYAFARFYEQSSDAERSLADTRRYLATFHPELTYDLAVTTIRGYSQGDWQDVFAAVLDGYGTAADHTEQYRQWLYGDVWIVTSHQRGYSISGIYADDAEEAVKHFRNSYEDDQIRAMQAQGLTDPDEAPRPHEPVSGALRVSWSIDSEEDLSPAQAAFEVYKQHFTDRLNPVNQPAPDSACVFDVALPDGRSIQIDLASEAYAHLFTK